MLKNAPYVTLIIPTFSDAVKVASQALTVILVVGSSGVREFKTNYDKTDVAVANDRISDYWCPVKLSSPI
jgi:hypothetical protein